jgi:hypothetical protein
MSKEAIATEDLPSTDKFILKGSGWLGEDEEVHEDGYNAIKGIG